MLCGGPQAAEWFESALQTMRLLAGYGSLTDALRSQLAVEIVLDVWSRTPVPGIAATPALTLADALAVTDLVEHFLRPLQLPAPVADLVHATANGPSVLVGLMAKWEAGTPVVLSEHGVYLRERLLAVRREGYSRAMRTVLVRFFHRLTELGYRHVDAVLPVSDFNARWAVRGGAPAHRVRTLHNGVDPGDLPLLTDEPAEPTLAFVGRIDPLKDIDTLVRAFALVRGQVPAARLRLFGGVPTGNEAYAAEIHRLVDDLGLGAAVTFEGPVSPVTQAFAAGHVVVLSSLSEGLPLTVIEAGMSGRPTVVTDVGGGPRGRRARRTGGAAPRPGRVRRRVRPPADPRRTAPRARPRRSGTRARALHAGPVPRRRPAGLRGAHRGAGRSARRSGGAAPAAGGSARVRRGARGRPEPHRGPRMTRHHAEHVLREESALADATASSVDPIEAAVVLESAGMNDRVARDLFGAHDVLMLAERVMTHEGPDRPVADPVPVRPQDGGGAARRTTFWFHLRGVLYAVPALVTLTLLPAVDPVESALVLGGLVLSWAWSYGVAGIAWAHLGNQDPAGARRFLRRALVGGVLLAAVLATVVVFAALIVTSTCRSTC